MKKNLIILLSALLLSSGSALAQTQAPAPQASEPSPAQKEQEITDNIRINLMAKIGTKADSVRPSPVKGLYEAAVGHNIVYVDENADHIIMGELFDTKTRKNLTQEAQEKLMRIQFSELPLEDAIKTVKGDGSRQIAVFSDPNCGFCKKLEANLKDLKDVTIYTFLYPVITPGSKDVSANIWCAKDPSAAWKGLMTENKAVPSRAEGCDTSALDRNIRLGSKLKIDGTPTIFVPSGMRAPGAATLEHIEKLLSEK